jgi:hypothetical protein
LADSTTTTASSTVLAPSITARARVGRSGSSTAIESGVSVLAIAQLSRSSVAVSRGARAMDGDFDPRARGSMTPSFNES